MDTKEVQQLLKDKKIYEVINPRLVQGPPDLSVEEAVRIMQEKSSGYIVIAKNNKPVGVFTENDVLFKILGKKVDWSRPVSEFMTPNPRVLGPRDSVGQAIEMMGENRFYHIPLVSPEGDLTGVLSVRSLIRFLSEFYPTEIYNLPPVVDAVMETPEGG